MHFEYTRKSAIARLPRLYIPGCAQHVIQRGNNREACFYDEGDYKAYLSFLKDAAIKYQVAIHAFVLMTNHVHLLMTPGSEQGVSRMMQAQGRKYERPVPGPKDRYQVLKCHISTRRPARRPALP